MKFAHLPWLIGAMAFSAGLIVLMVNRERAARNKLATFAASRLLELLTRSVSRGRRRLKQVFLILGITLCALALARPQWGYHWEEAKRKGIDVMFAVDVSRSMLAQDVNPSRLERARIAVLDFLEKMPGDRVGLIAFAGTAFLQCPLTLDHDAFRNSVEALEPGIIPRGGSNLAAAIREAQTAYRMGSPAHKILIFITDGEDLEAGGIAEARKAAEDGVKIFTVGVGTSSGELIPVLLEQGGTGFVKDEKGEAVKSRLDENTLRQIAEASGGLYENLGQHGEGLERIYSAGLGNIPRQEISSRMIQIFMERYQWPLAAGLLFLVLEFMISDRKAGASPFTFSFRKTPLWILSALLLQGNLQASPASAEKAYQKGEFQRAYEEYRKSSDQAPHKGELHFNTGAAAYRLKKYDDAALAFQRALRGDDPSLQQQAFYNLGNTQYRLGEKTEKNDVQATIQTWQQAIDSYERALKIKKDDPDAQYNLEFVKRRLQELQKQQPPPEKQNDQPKDKKEDSKDPKEQDPQQQPSSSNKPRDGEEKNQGKEADKGEKEKKEPTGGNEPQKKNEEARGQNTGNEKKEAGQEDRQRARPGYMTKEEAKNLLDALKSDERKMPVVAPAEQQGQADEPVMRDW